MTQPADITLYDELRSIQMLVHIEFPADKIRLERPQEDVEYDILIEPPSEIISNARGTYLSDEVMPLVIQRWCDTYLEAVDAAERLKRLFSKGSGQVRPRRIPVWKHPVPGEATPPPVPDPVDDAPDRFLKIEDLEARILPSQTIGQFVAILDLRVRGFRIIHDHSAPIVTTVARPIIEAE